MIKRIIGDITLLKLHIVLLFFFNKIYLFRHIKFSNGLNVLLISDPSTKPKNKEIEQGKNDNTNLILTETADNEGTKPVAENNKGVENAQSDEEKSGMEEKLSGCSLLVDVG